MTGVIFSVHFVFFFWGALLNTTFRSKFSFLNVAYKSLLVHPQPPSKSVRLSLTYGKTLFSFSNIIFSLPQFYAHTYIPPTSMPSCIPLNHQHTWTISNSQYISPKFSWSSFFPYFIVHTDITHTIKLPSFYSLWTFLQQSPSYHILSNSIDNPLEYFVIIRNQIHQPPWYKSVL